MRGGRQPPHLTPGKRADIITVEHDELGVSPVSTLDFLLTHAAQSHNVDMVMIDGVIHKQDGRLTKVDVPELLADAETMKRKLLKSADI